MNHINDLPADGNGDYRAYVYTVNTCVQLKMDCGLAFSEIALHLLLRESGVLL